MCCSLSVVWCHLSKEWAYYKNILSFPSQKSMFRAILSDAEFFFILGWSRSLVQSQTLLSTEPSLLAPTISSPTSRLTTTISTGLAPSQSPLKVCYNSAQDHKTKSADQSSTGRYFSQSDTWDLRLVTISANQILEIWDWSISANQILEIWDWSSILVLWFWTLLHNHRVERLRFL
jgi:hypothetical protein